MKPFGSIRPGGKLAYGIHKPSYRVTNLRQHQQITTLGCDQDGLAVDNQLNFPTGDLLVDDASWVYEIANPLLHKGATYIKREWADRAAKSPEKIRLQPPCGFTLCQLLQDEGIGIELLQKLPKAMQHTLAACSNDPHELTILAQLSCQFSEKAGEELGLVYGKRSGKNRAIIHDHLLFETVASNPHLPEKYRIAMVVRPGAQGDSPILADFHEDDCQIHEYLRCNSYIPGGHYAANMGEKSLRYHTSELSNTDMHGLRQLYYQRCYLQIAAELGLELELDPENMDSSLEAVRTQIGKKQARWPELRNKTTLWGWNFGFDYSAKGYRLHASHQQVHQQYALIPGEITSSTGNAGAYYPYHYGELIERSIKLYRQQQAGELFSDYLAVIRQHQRFDGNAGPSSLIIWEDEQVMLFVPPAQSAQWEIQLLTKPQGEEWPGNIFQCNSATRASLDRGLLKAQHLLAQLGATIVTTVEQSKPLGSELLQPLIYTMTPRLPEAPPTFSDQQLRTIIGHYPEDFAFACRQALMASGHAKS